MHPVCTTYAPRFLPGLRPPVYFLPSCIFAGKLLKFVAMGVYTCAQEIATDSEILKTMHLRSA